MHSSGVHPYHQNYKRLLMKQTNQSMVVEGKGKGAPSESVKVQEKTKKLVRKPRSPSLVLQGTITKVQEDNILINDEDDTAHTFKPDYVDPILKVSNPRISFVLVSNIFHNNIVNAFLNLTTSPTAPAYNPPKIILTHYLHNSDHVHPTST